MPKKLKNKTKIKYIIFIIILFNIYIVTAEEKKDDPAFKLPEETIMGKEKEKDETDGKKDARVEEKYELEKSSSEKIIPDLGLKEREQSKIQTQSKRNSQNELDISAGNYYGFNFSFNHKQDLKKLSYSLEFDKEYGNRSRPDSIYDHYTFGGQLFSNKIDFAFKLNHNKFDLPGMIDNRISDLSRKSENYKFSFDIKTIKNLFIIINGENTNIKDKTSEKDQSFGFKVIYDFNKNSSPYEVTSEIEKNKLAGRYSYAFYSFDLENQAILLNEKSQAKIGAGLSREGGEKLYLNPKLIVSYKYNYSTDLEAGVKRQNKKIEFYDLYGKNNFVELNLLPLKRINYWQIYSKALKRLKDDNSIEAKIFHDWIENYVVFDEDEANADGFWTPINLGNIQRDGVKITYLQKFSEKFSGQIDYKYLETWNENKAQTVPRQSDNISTVIKYDNQLYQLLIDGKYVGERYYDKDKNEKLGGYCLLGFLAGRTISEKLAIYAKADNILDKRYDIIKNYPGERARFLLGFKYIF